MNELSVSSKRKLALEYRELTAVQVASVLGVSPVTIAEWRDEQTEGAARSALEALRTGPVAAAATGAVPAVRPIPLRMAGQRGKVPLSEDTIRALHIGRRNGATVAALAKYYNIHTSTVNAYTLPSQYMKMPFAAGERARKVAAELSTQTAVRLTPALAKPAPSFTVFKRAPQAAPASRAPQPAHPMDPHEERLTLCGVHWKLQFFTSTGRWNLMFLTTGGEWQLIMATQHNKPHEALNFVSKDYALRYADRLTPGRLTVAGCMPVERSVERSVAAAVSK